VAQHDYILENQPGAAFRADLNEALQAIVSQNSGATEPSPSYPFQWWADTTAGVLKQRNAGNNSWLPVLRLDTGAAVNGTPRFTEAPPNYSGDEITVTTPHLRKMVWDEAQGKYVRAPWHQPCQLFFSYDNPVSIPGALPVRADALWDQADFPDVVERLGLSGTGTFTLVEARGEFVRVLDNGRGKDVGRVLRSNQASSIGPHRHNLVFGGSAGIAMPSPGAYTTGGGGTAIAGALLWNGAALSYATDTGSNIGSDTYPSNLAFPLWMTY
jgi:hypothetical protein